MNQSDICTQIVDIGQELHQNGLIIGSSGNITFFDRNKKIIAATASGATCQNLQQHDVIIVNEKGLVIDGDGTPTSELSFHLALYQKRADINAIIHTHSTYATTLACLNWELPAVHYLIGFAGKNVPVAPYATFGSVELAQNIVENIGQDNAVLLANHGLVAVGKHMNDAFRVAREVEFAAKLFYLSKCVGNPVIIDDAEMTRVVKKLQYYGKPTNSNA